MDRVLPKVHPFLENDYGLRLSSADHSTCRKQSC